MDYPAIKAWLGADEDLTVQYQVRLGIWTDWTRGSVLGQTLTLDRNDANLLTAFTASFVVFVGARVWGMASLVLHRYYSTPDRRDALHHQRQVVLRNTSSADSALLMFLRLFWAWRGSAVRSLRRIAPVLVLSMICTVGFTLAGGFSSQIQLGDDDLGSDVLLDGTNCAAASQNITTLQEEMAYFALASKWIDNSVNYAQQCYSANSAGLADCDYFASRRLPAYVNSTAACPFEASMCKTASSNIVLDTGLLDSHGHFGVNAVPDERILLRSVLQCAPLVTEGFAFPKGNFTAYNYGSRTTYPHNVTYEVYDLDWQYKLMDDRTVAQTLYQIKEKFSGTVNGTPGLDPWGTFTPIDQLARADADLTLIFLSGFGVFDSAPVHDPWYQATALQGTVTSTNVNGSAHIYRQDEAASPMGCASQWQFCNAEPSTCGPLASYTDAVSGALSAAFADERAAARLSWLLTSLGVSGPLLKGMLEEADVDALLAKQTVFGGLQTALPDNQWQLEVTNWFAISLAYMQQSMLETASGSAATEPGLVVDRPATAAAERMCRNQKIRTTRYASFSFFGLLFTYVLGLAVVALSFSLEPVLGCLYRRRGYRRYSFAEWNTHSTLQLQRLAHDGEDGWAGCMDDVPVTKDAKVQLRSLDLRDPEYPKLSSVPPSPDHTVLVLVQKEDFQAADASPTKSTKSVVQSAGSSPCKDGTISALVQTASSDGPASLREGTVEEVSEGSYGRGPVRDEAIDSQSLRAVSPLST